MGTRYAPGFHAQVYAIAYDSASMYVSQNAAATFVKYSTPAILDSLVLHPTRPYRILGFFNSVVVHHGKFV